MTTTRSNRSTKEASSDSPQLHILIVEDCADSAESTAILLRVYGHEVQIAMDGIEALEKARAHKPDVVLLDIGLPGMNGYEVARALHGQRPQKTPFLIALTGYGQKEDLRAAAAAGFDLHLLKPVDPDQLQTILERFKRVIRFAT